MFTGIVIAKFDMLKNWNVLSIVLAGKRKLMATINDICRITGFSKATVSRAINETGQVKESTRKVIHAAMQQLNFRPNLLAQALANKSGNSIGLVLSDFDGSYFGHLLKNAALVAEQTNKQLIVTDGHNEPEREKQAIYSLVDRRCSVLIVYTRHMPESDMLAIQQEIGLPIIFLGRALPLNSGYSVCFDNKHATLQAMEHLLSLGHSKIAYFGPPAVTPSGIVRMETYREMLQQSGVEYHEEWYQCSTYSIADGYHAAKRYLAQGTQCSALFAASDSIAFGAMQAFREAGLSLPNDMSIASIDDEELSAYMSPSLTSYRFPLAEMVHHAMAKALKLMDGESVPFESKVFRGALNIRSSAVACR
ncbi:MAG: LacI family DNA-binding transcriptional regulator [Enterovibrio sp.]